MLTTLCFGLLVICYVAGVIAFFYSHWGPAAACFSVVAGCYWYLRKS